MTADSSGTPADSQAVLISEDQIRDRVGELGRQITAEFAGIEPIVVVVMQGAVVFFADLIRKLSLEVVCDAVCISSYGNERQPATEPRLVLAPRLDWAGRDVLFVESIVDTGKTAELLLCLARDAHARTARICALLDKPSRRVRDVEADYVGFTIPDRFVIGYGLDYQGRGRNLPHVVAGE